MSFLEALTTNPLIQYAMIAALFASIASGVIGSYVVVKRIVFISGSIAHSVLGGMGFFLWLQRTQGLTWLTPLHGALVAGILSALAIGWIQMRYKQREDAVIAALWSTGMAIGVIFISMTPGSNVELSDFLVGNILWVSSSDLWMLLALDALIVALVWFFYEKFLVICFDEDQASLQRIPVQGLYFLLLALIAVSIVILIQIVGIILVITMLTLPPTIANLFTRKLPAMMCLAVIIGMIFSSSGIAISYHLDWPPGATIALIAGLCYISTLLISKNAFSTNN
jgi:zinc transport system permease protein